MAISLAPSLIARLGPLIGGGIMAATTYGYDYTHCGPLAPKKRRCPNRSDNESDDQVELEPQEVHLPADEPGAQQAQPPGSRQNQQSSPQPEATAEPGSR